MFIFRAFVRAFSISPLIPALLVALAAPFLGAQAARAAETKAFLHVPWTVLEQQLNRNFASSSRLTTGDDSSVFQASGPAPHRASVSPAPIPFHRDLPDRVLTVDSLDWMISGVSIDGTAVVNLNQLGPESATVAIPESTANAVIGNISVDQTVTTEVDGVTVHVHFQAVCSAIHLHQTQAYALAQFALAWNTGAPAASLASFALNWPANSWTIDDFSCTGPSGLPDELHRRILAYLKDPQTLKPQIETALAQTAQSVLNVQLGRLKQTIALQTGHSTITFNAGALIPVTTGLLTDLSINAPDPGNLQPASTTPDDRLLAALPTDRPAVIGHLDSIQDIADTELQSRPAYSKLNLQSITAFHDLMHSRLEQLFVWCDLLNYPSDAPFYLRVRTPQSLTITAARAGALRTVFDLSAVVQSYRDKKWWSFLTVAGRTHASVHVSVANGVLTYSTTVTSSSADIAYGLAYKNRFSPGHFPKKDLLASIEGEQSLLSGRMTWPRIAFSSGDVYEASGLAWYDTQTFIMPWALVQ